MHMTVLSWLAVIEASAIAASKHVFMKWSFTKSEAPVFQIAYILSQTILNMSCKFGENLSSHFYVICGDKNIQHSIVCNFKWLKTY